MSNDKPKALDLLKQLKALNARVPADKPTEAHPSLEQTIGKDSEIIKTAQDLKQPLEEAQAFLELHQARKELQSLRQEYQAYRTEKQQTIIDQTLKIGQLETQLEALTEQSLEAVQAKEDLKAQLETAKRELAELEESYKDLEENSAIGEKHLREDLAEEENKTRDLETQIKATAEGQQRLLINLSDLRQYTADLEEDSDNMREFGQGSVGEVKKSRDKTTIDQNKIRDQDNEIERLTAVVKSLDELVAQNESITKQLHQKEGELLDNESKLTTLKREYDVYKFTQKETATELELQATTKQTELKLAQERVTSLEQDVAAYLSQIRESQGTNQDTATELERASQELTQARECVKLTQDELFLLKTQNEGLTTTIKDKEREFEERKEFLQTQYTSLEQDRDGLKAQLQEYETQFSGKRDKIKVLREAITEQRNIIHKLREVERINQELAEARQTDAQQYETKIDALEQANRYLGGRLAKAVTRIFRQKSAIKEQQVKHSRIRELEERLEALTADKALVDGQLTDLGQEKDHLQKQNKHMGREYEKTIDGLSDQLLIERRKYRENKSSFREYALAATISIALLAFGYQMIEYAKILTQEPAKAIDVHELIKKK